MYFAVTLEYGRTRIRNSTSAPRAKKMRKTAVSAYSGIFLLIISLLTLSYGGTTASPENGIVATTQASSWSPNKQGGPDKISVDQLTAASAVTSLAETANLPAAGDLREATTTLYIKKQLAQTDAEVITKPQIVQPTTSTERGITSYVAQEGETIETIAAKYGISVETLRWANNTNSDSVEPGKTLVVPMIDGVVYTVKADDTLEKLAERYKVDAERVVLYNDLDVDSPLVEGAKIVLPNGNLPETERPGYVTPRPVVTPAPIYGGASSTTSSSYGYASIAGGNRYALGNCTWYAYERRAELGRPIGGLWGNATSWATSARAAGFVVNNTPAPGAIFQYGGGYGHVGIVERVDEQNLYVSDMNYAGYGVVTHRTIPRSSTGHYSYIHDRY
ncbi:hypothetical protein B7Y94_00530 [Candidatus Saccharibacteria bacterium 32-49-12]|nr:MAG: hypothetical protein B7Y94_00530 [Candidatus Saccharibacteria bacterium 32-49-12]